MLVDPDGAIALLREQAERDLVLVAVVCGMVDSLPQARDRLLELKDVWREYGQAHDGRRSEQRSARVMAYRGRDICDRLAHVVEQLIEREEQDAGT